ncbi:MAG: biotin attachment protein, partial [Gemmatimonadaceae bacterium]|nr:biotin attachment protein [Chitinophagaceae bacterium]
MKKNYFNDDIQQLSKDLDVHSYKGIYQLQRRSRVRSWLLGIIILIGIIAFLPWTQNIRASGTVTTLRQEQRPQQVNAVIAGSAIKWFVKEGDFVKAGDTILKLGEVKVDYFDPKLLDRTSEQISSKIASIKGYKNKASTSITQAGALQKASVLKLESLDIKIAQQKLKLQTEEAELAAAVNELRTYTRQIEGAKVMLDSGAISLT